MAGCALERSGQELHEGDVLRPETLRCAGEGVDVDVAHGRHRFV